MKYTIIVEGSKELLKWSCFERTPGQTNWWSGWII